MNKFFIIIFLVIIFLCGSFEIAKTELAQQPSDIIILFDQSGSIGKYDPKLVSKAWLLTFLETFKNKYKIDIVGFDEDIHPYSVVDNSRSTNSSELNTAMNGVTAKGLATDLETPFLYLLEHAENSTQLAVIISDGEPEVWDKRLRYLSRRVQHDQRYDDLNNQYQYLKKSFWTEREAFNNIGALYQDRNLRLIEGHMPSLSKAIGSKTIILDLSGKSPYLKKWADEIGAHYLPIRVNAQENQAEQLHQAMVALQKQTGAIMKEKLPDDHERSVSTALTAIPEIGGNVQTPPLSLPTPPESSSIFEIKNNTSVSQPPSSLPKDVEAPIAEKSPEEKQSHVMVNAETSWFRGVDLNIRIEDTPIFIQKLLTYFLRQDNKHEENISANILENKRHETEIPILTPWNLIVPAIILFLCGSVVIYLFFRRQQPEAISSFSGNLPFIVDKDNIAPLDVVYQYIDEKAKNVISDAEMLPKHLDLGERSIIDQEFSLRIVVPPGAMNILWINQNGDERYGSAINISMHGIKFKTNGCNINSVVKIICPRIRVALKVVRANIVRSNADYAIAMLIEFENNLDDWMRWVEIITRIDE
ncbi:VWFA domain-containing protein [Azospirillaceae bacterium]